MTGLGDASARRTASNARIPDDRVLIEDARHPPEVKSDRKPRCELREGYRVHFVATTDNPDKRPVVREIHCASAHCDYHKHPDEGVNETVSVDTDATHFGRDEEYDEDKCIYAGAATLEAEFDEDGEIAGLGLTDVELASYVEQFSIPAPTTE